MSELPLSSYRRKIGMNAWNLGKLFGIQIRVHWTFLILPIWVYFSTILAGSGVAMGVVAILFTLAIFGCVLFHELGHALAARQFGILTRNITLLPIGGVAALERMPRKSLQELWIAVAGPLVNVAIALTLAVGLLLIPLPTESVILAFVKNLVVANVILVVFNMIPAFPMDGGRVLRSLLAMKMDYVRATQIAATVGQVFAIGLGLLGLFLGDVLLVLIGCFVFFAARAEKNFVAARPLDDLDPAHP